ncbi:MAG: hypothetical protein CMF31_05130 [Kordiimonas sp.]|nr:hypothetical protein [Kordiimonas sp.]
MATSTIGDGKDYSTLTAWEAALPATLTEDEIAECYVSVGHVGTDISIAGVTTSTSAKIIIRAATGEETTGQEGSGPSIYCSQSQSHAAIDLNTGCDHVEIKGVEFVLLGSNSHALRDWRSSAPAGGLYKIDDCFVYGEGSNAGGNLLYAPKGDYEVTNCLGFRMNTAGGGSSVTYTNCTWISRETDPNNVQYTPYRYAHVIRSYAAYYGPTSGYRDFLNQATLTDCASADTTADLLDNVDPYSQYTDPVNGDWSFKAGNVLEGAATGGADVGFVAPSAGGGTDYIATAGQATGNAAGVQPSLTVGAAYTATAGQGTAQAVGLAPALTTGAAYTSTAGQGTATAAALQPNLTIGAGYTETAAQGTTTATGLAPTLSLNGSFTATAGIGAAVTAGGQASLVIGEAYAETAGVGTATTAGLAPTLSLNGSYTATAGQGATTAAALQPSLVIGEAYTSTAAQGTAQAAGIQPALDLTASYIVTAGQSVANAAGLAPDLTIGAAYTSTAAIAAANAVGIQPALDNGEVYTPHPDRTLTPPWLARTVRSAAANRTLIV